MICVALVFGLIVSHFGGLVQCAEEHSEITLLSTTWNSSDEKKSINFKAFGKQVDLLLTKNDNLLSPKFQVWKLGEDNDVKKLDIRKPSSCYYTSENSFSSAAVNLCNPNEVHGFVFLGNDSLEILPLSNEQSNNLTEHTPFVKPHIIKRREIPAHRRAEAFNDATVKIKPRLRKRSSAARFTNNLSHNLTIELAVFLDNAAYRTFRILLANNDTRITEMIESYVNNLQALFYHPSLGQRIQLTIVYMLFMNNIPDKLKHLDSRCKSQLAAFSLYSKRMNPQDESSAEHWDIALYLSGLDLYELDATGRQKYGILGCAPVNGACTQDSNSVIVEFGTKNSDGIPYTSSGFNSIYIAAHEIGHNLGMHHDSKFNRCPHNGFIMSPDRDTQGETHWSSCSRVVARGLAQNKPCLRDSSIYISDYDLLPGRNWTSKMQCEVFMFDYSAVPFGFIDCSELRCTSPKWPGEVFPSGPAMDGTWCGTGKECKAGECLLINGQPLIHRQPPLQDYNNRYNNDLRQPLTTQQPPFQHYFNWDNNDGSDQKVISGMVQHIDPPKEEDVAAILPDVDDYVDLKDFQRWLSDAAGDESE